MSTRLLAVIAALVIFITVGMYFMLKRTGSIKNKALDEAVSGVPAKKPPPPRKD